MSEDDHICGICQAHSLSAAQLIAHRRRHERATPSWRQFHQDLAAWVTVINTLFELGPTVPKLALPLPLWCPVCGWFHLDEGVWAEYLHKTHLCLKCGIEWTPFSFYTRGVWPDGLFDRLFNRHLQARDAVKRGLLSVIERVFGRDE